MFLKLHRSSRRKLGGGGWESEGRFGNQEWHAGGSLTAPTVLPAGTLAYPYSYPFGRALAQRMSSQNSSSLPHPGAATFTASLSQGRRDLVGSLPMGNVMGYAVQAWGTASLIWAQLH